MLLLGLAFRNALRNVQRTMFTAGTVVLGTALLVIALTWEEGVFGGIIKMATAATGHVRVVNPQYAAREDLLPIYENLPDVDPVLEKVRAVPGVKAAFPRILNGCTLTAGEEIGDVFGLVVGAPQEWYTEWLDVDSMVTEGRFLDPANDGEVVIGQGLADRTGAKLGSVIVMLGQTQDGALSPMKGTVVGIVHGGNAMVDQQVYLPLKEVQYMADMDGGATEILVYGADKDQAQALRDAVQAAVPELTVQAWSERDPWAGLLAVAGFIQAIVSFIIVFITALAVLNTMMMSVLERTAEIGVLRALGLTRIGAVFLFVVEALSIAILGGLFGVGIGSIGGYMLEVWGVQLGDNLVQNLTVPLSSRMYGDLTMRTVIVSFVLGLAMAALGSAVPALRAASIQPVTAMRARR